MVYNTKIFIEKAKEIHGDKYDYSKVNYINSSTKVCIICPKHGEFWQIPASHLRGIGCNKCGIENASNKCRKTTEDFIKEAKSIHGDKYDYSKVKYENAHKKICIICPEHGEFWQKPMLHINQKCGCKKCGTNKTKTKTSLTFDEFVERAKKVHGDKYDYSKVGYVNYKTKVCIICPIHGEFWQTPSVHLNGEGCKKCGYENVSQKNKKITTEEWIKKAKKVHGDRYDYSKTKYSGYYNKLTIICPKHGEFQQIAYDHIQGKGCPKCRKSKLEIEIGDFLKNKNIEYQDGVRPPYLSEGKSHLSLDFYLPKYNAAIECQGKQHFEDGTFYDNRKETIKERDKRKYDLCKGNVDLFYYSNFKIEKYLDKVYNNKEELLNAIKHKYEEKLL